MKQIKFFAMLLALTMTMGFTSCSEDDNGGNDDIPLVGAWHQTNDYGTEITLEFNNDKTGRVRYEYPNNGGGAYDIFEYDYDSEERELEIIGDTQLEGRYDVTITATKLILDEYYDGIRYVFNRI